MLEIVYFYGARHAVGRQHGIGPVLQGLYLGFGLRNRREYVKVRIVRRSPACFSAGMEDEDPIFFRAQAEKCRWLASDANDPQMVRALRQIADDYDSQAAAFERASGEASKGA
jgi:hypothetical protein